MKLRGTFLKYFGTIKVWGLGSITVLGFENTLGYVHGSYSESYLKSETPSMRNIYSTLLSSIEYRMGGKNTLTNGFDIQEVRKYAMALELAR